MRIDPRDLVRSAKADRVSPIPLGGTRAERMQRLQIGLLGLGAMVLIVALADIIITRAQHEQSIMWPETVPTVTASDDLLPRDPLADAGVVPAAPVNPEDAEGGNGQGAANGPEPAIGQGEVAAPPTADATGLAPE